MSLPVLAIPEDTIQLFGQKKEVRIRPYLVGEEKLFLIAQASDDEKEVLKAVKQIIKRCTFDTCDPETLATFDIEWLFLQLRARSVSNIIETKFICQANVANGKCEALVPVRIDIGDIKMVTTPGHTNRIMLDDKIGVTLKYPTADIPESQEAVDTLVAHLATIFTANGEVTEVSEQTPAEVRAWVETFSRTHIAKIQTFFDTMPRLSYTFTFKCDKCGYSDEVTLRGLQDFFD